MKTKRVLFWVSAIVLALFVVYPIIAKVAHWPGAAIGFVFWPLSIALLLVVVNGLFAYDKGLNEKSIADCKLKVDYRVRYSLISIMKIKRRAAWLQLSMSALSALIAIVAVLGLFFYDADNSLQILCLGVFLIFGVFGWIGFDKMQATKVMEKGMKSNNQATFEDAMRRWTQHSKRTTVGYILMATILVIMIVMILILENS